MTFDPGRSSAIVKAIKTRDFRKTPLWLDEAAEQLDGALARISELEAETESMASQSVADHIEYKNRRNQQFAAYELAHRATIAYLLDRCDQMVTSSKYLAFLEEVIDDLAIHRHVQCAEAGEYDDLMPRVKKIIETCVRVHGERVRSSK